jgi:hypothetical protein
MKWIMIHVHLIYKSLSPCGIILRVMIWEKNEFKSPSCVYSEHTEVAKLKKKRKAYTNSSIASIPSSLV